MARSIRLPCATDVDVLQLVGVSCSIESETFTLFTNNMLMGVSNGIKWGLVYSLPQAILIGRV